MNNTNQIDIHDNALTTDYVVRLADGYCYKGRNGARYKIVYYTYANEWGDHEHSIYGRTLEAVLNRYNKLTGRLHDVQDDEDGMTTEELAYLVEEI